MPDEDREHPIDASDEPADDEAEERESAAEPPPSEPDDAADLGSSFSRMLGALKERAAAGPAAVRWVAAWQPLVAALQSLAVTVGKLIWRARQAHASGDEGALLDEEAREEFAQRFRALYDAFPEAGEIFFGVDEVDRLIRETLENKQAREAVVGFGRLVEARMNGLIARVVEWGLAEDGPELSLDRLEGFVHGLQGLLQEVLDRWVLPQVYGEDDADDDDDG